MDNIHRLLSEISSKANALSADGMAHLQDRLETVLKGMQPEKEACPFCAGSGIATVETVKFDATRNQNVKTGTKTRECPLGCNPENVERTIEASQKMIQDETNKFIIQSRNQTGPDKLWP